MRAINWFMALIGWFVFSLVWIIFDISDKIVSLVDDAFLQAYDGGWFRYFVIGCVVYSIGSFFEFVKKAHAGKGDTSV